jgi:hypothetical protein
MKKEKALFTHQFFNWSELNKKAIGQVLGPTYRRDIIDSLEHFYDKFDCIGYT